MAEPTRTQITKLRIAIENYRTIIKKKKRGIIKKNAHEWIARARNGEDSVVIGTFDNEQEALDFYQSYTKEKLKSALKQLKEIAPDDVYLRGES